jgi:hypothetical protein
MKYEIVDNQYSGESSIDSDALGRLIVSVPIYRGMIDMNNIFNLCKIELYPDMPEPELDGANRLEMFKLFSDIWFHYAFCVDNDHIFTFKGTIVPDGELDQLFNTIFVPPRFTTDYYSVDLLSMVQEDDILLSP